jgi:hypothetical protein
MTAAHRRRLRFCVSADKPRSAMREAHLCLTRSLTLPAAAATTSCTKAGFQLRHQLQEATSCRAALACESDWCQCPVRTWLSYDEAPRSLHVQPVARTTARLAKPESGGILYLARCMCKSPPSLVCPAWPDTRSHVAAGSRDAAAVLTAAVIMIISDQKKAAMLNSVRPHMPRCCSGSPWTLFFQCTPHYDCKPVTVC